MGGRKGERRPLRGKRYIRKNFALLGKEKTIEVTEGHVGTLATSKGRATALRGLKKERLRLPLLPRVILFFCASYLAPCGGSEGGEDLLALPWIVLSGPVS